MHAAAYCGQADVMQLILDTGTEVASLDRNRRSAWDIAKLVGNDVVAGVIADKIKSYSQILGQKDV